MVWFGRQKGIAAVVVVVAILIILGIWLALFFAQQASLPSFDKELDAGY